MTITERINALLQHRDPEVRWLAGYTRRLVEAAEHVAGHLQRISNPEFRSRKQLEKALRGEDAS